MTGRILDEAGQGDGQSEKRRRGVVGACPLSPNFITPAKIVEYMAGAFDDTPMQESFCVVCLNRKNRPLCRSRISLGTVCNTLVHPREVFRIAVLASASAIAAVHNHPSGETLRRARRTWP